MSSASDITANKRKSQQLLAGPLPLDWQSYTRRLPRDAAQLISGWNTPSGVGSHETLLDVYYRNQPGDAQVEVTLYQRYTRPDDTIARNHCEYEYTDKHHSGFPTLTRPTPPPLFEYDAKVLSTDPDSVLGVKSDRQGKIEAAFPGNLGTLMWLRELDRRFVMVGVYRMTHTYFTKMSRTAPLDEVAMRTADDICQSMFGHKLTPDEVRSSS
jgi:hypothetical protein